MAEVRENGPYWIKVDKNYQWQIGYWYNDSRVWRLANPIDAYTNVYRVGPRILQPEEEIKVKRREGHYWVIIENRKDTLGKYIWSIGCWDMEYKCWEILGTEITYKDDIFTRIGPRLSPPEGE